MTLIRAVQTHRLTPKKADDPRAEDLYDHDELRSRPAVAQSSGVPGQTVAGNESWLAGDDYTAVADCPKSRGSRRTSSPASASAGLPPRARRNFAPPAHRSLFGGAGGAEATAVARFTFAIGGAETVEFPVQERFVARIQFNRRRRWVMLSRSISRQLQSVIAPFPMDHRGFHADGGPQFVEA